MTSDLRHKIAAEAARLMLRGKFADVLSARRQAARWLIRGRVPVDELPTVAEIQQELYALAGLERMASQSSLFDEDLDSPITPEELFMALRLMIEPLGRFRMNPELHPEGDALYHSLQVFELGRAEIPYDEEFLLACLLHDVGLAIDPRHAVPAAISALEGLVTDRTLFLIEHRPAATYYLQTGIVSKSLRKSPDFEELLLLARCNRNGRVPGTQVCSLDEALEYIAGLETAWDDAP
jgi:hypothetical protein